MNHKRLYVGDLAEDVTEHDLVELFSNIGTVESVNLVRNARQLHSFAFIEMTSPESAREAVQRLNGYTLSGQRLIVYTVPPRSRPRTASRA